jgi:predicted nucleic acid-binding protein
MTVPTFVDTSAIYRASLARRTSFVDHVSFEVMRTGGIDAAFTFDDDFVREGFATVPG